MNKVLVSTDIGSDIDDALSILSMLNSGIDIGGIYTVNGNIQSRAFIAKHLVDLADRKIDICLGDSQPISKEVKPYTNYEESYVDDRFIDKKESIGKPKEVYVDSKKVGIITNGLEHLAQQLSNGKYTVFSLGPMTTLAKLIESYPNESKKIDQLYIMGCRFDEHQSQEHNVRFDIEAAQRVFSSDIPIIVVPGELCEKYRLPASSLNNIKSAYGLYVKKMALGFITAKTAEIFGKESLAEFIKNEARPDPRYYKKVSGEKAAEQLDKKERLLLNLHDPLGAALYPDDFFKQYNELIKHLEDPQINYSRGSGLAKMLKLGIQKDISIADVYVPYCFANPNKIQAEKAKVKINSNGIATTLEGNEHTIVRNIDLDDFRKYLDRNLI